MNLREQIANSYTPKVEPVEAFGVTVYVREMDAGTVSSFYRWHTTAKDANGMDVMLAITCRTLCDATGKRLYKDDEAELLATLDPDDIRTVYEKAAALNEITDADVEDAEGN